MKHSNKFAIVLDNNERVDPLFEVIKNLNFVERPNRKQSFASLLKSVLVFDKKESYDYDLYDNNLWSWLEGPLGINKTYKTSKDFNTILEQLDLLAGKKSKKEKNMRIDIDITLPRASKPKHKVRVFNNFVKVGWNQYAIKIDPYIGNEYVLIKGNRYEVVRDIFRQGYLVEI